MAETTLRRWLRTGKGQLQLLGLTYLVAALLAGVAVTQRSFFEQLVREKYPAPAATTVALAAKLAAADLPASELRGLSAPSWTALYQLWVQAPTPEQDHPHLPRHLAATAPALAVTLVERTLVAGTPAQQAMAVRFASATGSAALLPALQLGTQTARRRGAEALLEPLEEARARLGSASAPTPAGPR